ncbi:efflux RND transporter permease subunit [Brumimicrobium mesophilum]|uniref:efflux RND transporter permease subunit n=1 Tax=Brumimicrobium mesophilum TaxID=392717 RepID=UPI001F48A66E|nr:MMPL family transporter [Brumimicrobium mesophilum]
MDNKYGNMLPKKSPAQDDYMQLKNMFGEDGGALVLAIKTDKLYTEENFLMWKHLGDSIAKLDGIKSVLSEADLFTIKNNTSEGKFQAEPIFSDETFKSKSIEEIRKEIRQVPLYNGVLYNDSTNVSLMMISIDEAYLSDQNKSGVVLDAEAIALGYEHVFGKMHFAGLPHIRVVMGKRVVSEMYIFIGLAIAVTSLLLYIFFRSFRVVGFSILVVFIAVIWSLGSIGLMGFKLSILMALIPPLMIVIGIPNCIFLLTKFHREVKDHGNKTKALSRVISKVGNATFLTNLTTALGFSTFAFTNSEKLVEFGVTASLNIMFVFVISITIIPILFSLTKIPKSRHLKHLEKNFAKNIVNKLVYITTTHRKRIYLVTVIVVGVAIFGATKMEATGNLTSDLPDSDPILQDILFIQDNFNGAIPFEILIDYKKDGRKFDKKTLEKVEAIQANLNEDTIFSKTISIVNFMKLINMSYYGNNPDMYKLIERKDMLRLKGYVDGFQEDMAKTQLVYEYQDSLRAKKTFYSDSLMLNYPKIAKQVMNYEADTSSADSIPPAQYPSQNEIKDFINNTDRSAEVLEASMKIYPQTAVGLSLKELIDTANTTYRLRMQVIDLGSYEIDTKIKSVSAMLDTILNPYGDQVDAYLEKFEAGETSYADSIFDLSNSFRNNTAANIADGNDSLLFQFDLDPTLLATYYDKNEFKVALEKAIDDEELSYLITGTSVVAAEGTQYLIKNLMTSLIIAIFIIAILMAFLFRSWRMVVISLVPNFIPLLVTAGIMGLFAIPIKPSTLLVFSIAFGISVDDTIHFLAKYRQELKVRSYDQRACVINALYETGLSMFYTSIVLFFGFSMFAFSQFGGTKALGLLVSLTMLVAMLTNLTVLPSLLLSLENRIATKAFREPFINIYDEEIDIELSELEIDPRTRIDYDPNNPHGDEEDTDESEDLKS